LKFKKSFLIVTLGCFLGCCISQHRADKAQSENANHQSSGASTGSLVEQFADTGLLNQLKGEHGIERPFAWWSWEGKKNRRTIIGVGQKGNLKSVEAVETSNGYVTKPSQSGHELSVRVWKSGDLELEKYLPDTEFPFKSFVVATGGCNVHFVLLWQALNRSFEKQSAFLNAINLRILVEQNGIVVSNKLQDLLFQSVDQTLVEDVNKDGKPDFLVIGFNRLRFVNIWTVGGSCSVAPLRFKEGDHLLESARDRDLFLRKNKATGRYDIHVIHREPITKNDRVYFEVTESVYQWDSPESVYKVTQTRSWLESFGGK
jgi:hypothetical protein